jgi:putative hemolysin
MFASLVSTLLLVGIVGVCNAAHVALTNARRNRLEAEVSKRSLGAVAAISLMERFENLVAGTRVVVALSVVAATLIAGGTLVNPVADLVAGSRTGAYMVVLAGLAFVLVVFGDLLPSQIASRYPETVGRLLAPLVSILVSVVRPCASIANALVSWILGPVVPEQVSDEDVEEDIRDLVDEGQRAGVIEPGEREIINRVFKLDDKPLATLMTPRVDVVFLEKGERIDDLLVHAASSAHSWFPVRGASEDDVLGIVCLNGLVELRAHPERFPGGIDDLLVEPLEVPLSMNALKLLELFRESGDRFAVVRDEYGGLSGIVTVYDVLQVIVGEIGESASAEDRSMVQREDGSYLVDASSDVREVFEVLGIADESPFNGAEFHSVGGYVMTTLGFVPKEGERFEAFGYSFEVVDMDNNRIDKVLVSRTDHVGATAALRVAGGE